MILYRVFESSQSGSDSNEQEDPFAFVLFWMNNEAHFVSIKALEFFKEIYEVQWRGNVRTCFLPPRSYVNRFNR